LCRSGKRSFWRSIRPFNFLACAAWNLCVYLASLWRLQRYSDIGAWKRSIAGLPFYGHFRQPFLANRLQDFWRRWHVSLSTWLRDYLYIPLGGSADGQMEKPPEISSLPWFSPVSGMAQIGRLSFFGAIHGVVLAVERYFFPAKAKSQGVTLLVSPPVFSPSGRREF